MFEKIIKRDRNEILESVLEQKDIDEKTKNLLQGILYKIEVSYNDYKKAKVINKTEKQYVDEIITNIKRKCNKIITVSFNDKIGSTQVKEELDKNKFYSDEKQIITYPIEEKLLYAIEKSTNNKKIVNTKYGIFSSVISDLIITGKNIDRVEVLRDFNGWSWTTVKSEIENIKANLVFQTLQILVGEEFMQNWTLDTDGFIDYFDLLKKEIGNKFGDEISKNMEDIIERISIINEANVNYSFKKDNMQKLNDIQIKINLINDVPKYINELTDKKKAAEREIANLQKILSSEKSIKEEYYKINDGVPIEKKIFSVKVLKQQIKTKIRELLSNIE